MRNEHRLIKIRDEIRKVIRYCDEYDKKINERLDIAVFAVSQIFRFESPTLTRASFEKVILPKVEKNMKVKFRYFKEGKEKKGKEVHLFQVYGGI